jgi:hypothetical protein
MQSDTATARRTASDTAVRTVRDHNVIAYLLLHVSDRSVLERGMQGAASPRSLAPMLSAPRASNGDLFAESKAAEDGGVVEENDDDARGQLPWSPVHAGPLAIEADDDTNSSAAPVLRWARLAVRGSVADGICAAKLWFYASRPTDDGATPLQVHFGLSEPRRTALLANAWGWGTTQGPGQGRSGSHGRERPAVRRG